MAEDASNDGRAAACCSESLNLLAVGLADRDRDRRPRTAEGASEFGRGEADRTAAARDLGSLPPLVSAPASSEIENFEVPGGVLVLEYGGVDSMTECGSFRGEPVFFFPLSAATCSMEAATCTRVLKGEYCAVVAAGLVAAAAVDIREPPLFPAKLCLWSWLGEDTVTTGGREALVFGYELMRELRRLVGEESLCGSFGVTG